MAVPYCSEGNSDRNATNQHQISPTPELVQQWMNEVYGGRVLSAPSQGTIDIATCAAQWAWNQRGPQVQAAADREREDLPLAENWSLRSLDCLPC
jgi:hypothetical protein